MSRTITLHVNGAEHRIEGDPERSLLSVLREDLGLTGSKYGCGEGQCGACTVLFDGTAIRSCLVPVDAASGVRIRTIEDLADEDCLHPLQTVFLDAVAVQCGYCTSGMIMSAAALLEHNPRPERDDIIRSMVGNVCRCGTYNRIVDAIASAAAKLPGGGR